MKTVIFTLLLALCCNLEVLCAQNRQADSLALVSVYQSTNGVQWTRSWDLNQAMDTWNGVQLNNNGRVEHVRLAYNGLMGTLPTQLNLSELLTLEFRGIDITGGLPDFVGMPKLTGLDISGTQLSGNIPNFSYLPKLIVLIIQGNQLSGAIPNFTNLPDLRDLTLDGNQLGGLVPDFTNLPKLRGLSAARNGLGGPVPDFTNLPLLDFLRLNDNKLSGAIPNFNNLPKLNSIIVAQNQLTGSIPNFSNLPLLNWIDLSDNKLSGSIPNFRNMPFLQDILLRENQLSGSIPDFSFLQRAKVLELGDNQLTGSIPNFSNLPLLLDIKVEDNQLTGSIPTFNNCPDLQKVNVSNNQLEGRVPIFSAATDLQWLFLDGNQFTFEDIVPGHNFLRSKIISNTGSAGFWFRYSKQDSVGQTQQVALPIGGNYTLDLGVDAGISTNIYYWYKDGVFIDSVIGSNQYTLTNFQATDVGNYHAQITNTRVTDPSEPNHNLILDSRTITVDIGTSTTAIPTRPTLTIYPNPSTGQVQIELPTVGEAQLQVINTVGQVVYQAAITTTNTQQQLSFGNYAAGLYWVRLTSATGQVWQASVLKK